MMSPFLLLTSLAALYMGALNSLKVFFLPGIAPAFFNICMISSMVVMPAVLLANDYPSVYALGIGVVTGGIIQGLVQLPKLVSSGYGPLWPAKIITQKSLKVFKLLGPGLIGFAATQINLLVNSILATGTVVGAVSWLSYGFRLFQLPVGILSVSIGNSNLVHFSQAWKTGDREKAKEYLFSSYFLSWLLIVPALVVLVALGEEVVHLIYERGKFDTEDTNMTALALRYYAIGLPFYGMLKIFVPSFYAMDQQKIPVYASIASITINIIFCVSLVPTYGFSILAVGTTLSIFLNVMIQSVVLKKQLSLGISSFINLRLMKLIFSGAIAYRAVLYLKSFFLLRPMPFMQKAIVLAGEIGAIFVLYFILVYLLGERKSVNNLLRRFIK
jgi:putative peptidoglycan lipid II flippase